MKTIPKISMFLLVFFNSYLLFGTHYQNVKPFKFELISEANLDTLLEDLYTIYIEDNIILVNTENTSVISIIDPLIDKKHLLKDTLIEINLKASESSFLEHRIKFEERGNLDIFLLTPIDGKDGFYELLVKYKFNNQIIRFKGENLSEKGLETLFLIKKTIDYTNNIEILNLDRNKCGEYSYSDALYRFGFQILDTIYQPELLTFKLIKESNCCEIKSSFNYQLQSFGKTLLITRNSSTTSPFNSIRFNNTINKWNIVTYTYEEMDEKCECVCLFCYIFEVKTKEKFNNIFFRQNE